MKSLLFYPKGFITSAQSLLNTSLQQSHQITNVACRTIVPIISEGYHENVISIVVDGQSAETFVQVFFSVFFFFISGMETVHSLDDVQHGSMQNEAWRSYLYQKKLCCCVGRGMNASASALCRAYALVSRVRR